MRAFAVMASSPPRKKKRTERQLTLFGGFAVGPSVYRKKDPVKRSLYEKYIDSYVERHDGGADAERMYIKGDIAKVEKFVSDVEEWKTRQVPDIPQLGVIGSYNFNHKH